MISKENRTAKMLATKEANIIRRANMSIKSFELKIDESCLSKKKANLLKDCFVQAKWLYNYLLTVDIFACDGTLKQVAVKIFNSKTNQCDIEEIRQLTIGSCIKGAITQRLQQSIINLSKKKVKGIKVGKLKFKKEVNSIPIADVGYGKVCRIYDDKYISILKLGKLKVSGLEQIKPEYETANANLIRKASGYFLKVICYCPKEIILKEGVVGIDMGIKDNFVLSNGEKYSYKIELPNKLKRKQHNRSRMIKGSKNYVKACKAIKKDHEYITNKKKDASNKFVNKLKKFKQVIIQDEMIASWKKNFGKQISTSILGITKAKIKRLENSIVISKSLPTTKICPKCQRLNDIPLSQRIYSCSCGFHEDRDIKAAKTIAAFGLASKQYKTSKELRSLPAEELASVFGSYAFLSKLIPLKQEVL